MNPLRVTATNYRSFEQLDIELPTGVTAIVSGGARSNGFGKSSVIDAIDLALFAERGELPQWLTTGEEELELALEFEHAGWVYRVRRQYSGRGRGKTTLDFERCEELAGFDLGGPATGERWEPLSRENAAATQELICETIGLTRTTFRASSFLAQGDGAAFTEATPAARKGVLAKILGLEVWDGLADRAHRELRQRESSIEISRAAIVACEEQAARRPDVAGELDRMRRAQADASLALAEAERELEAAQAAHAGAAVAGETVRVHEAELAAAAAELDRATLEYSAAVKAGHELADKQVELAEISADAAAVDALEARVGELRAAAVAYAEEVAGRDRQAREVEQRQLAHDRMLALAKQTHDESAELRRKAAHLEEHIGEASSCDRCGQTLGAEAAARAAASYRADADALDERVAGNEETCRREAEVLEELRQALAARVIAPVEDPAPVEQQLRAARSAAVQRAQLAEQVDQLTVKAARRGELEQLAVDAARVTGEKRAVLEKARAAVPDMTVLDAKAGLCQITVRDARQLIEARNGQIVRAEADLERIAEAEQKLAELSAGIEQVAREVDVRKLAERAFGRDGIPALIVENAAIPQLELEANRILGELGGATADCRVELRTQRVKKDGDVRETLDIPIVTPTGERAYETFSGGERTRLNLALRIALARLLAHRRGAESRILCIDEPDGLDQSGMQALATVLQGVGSDFDRVLLVSHHPELATAFDQSIVVAKDGDVSRVDDLEAVAA